MTVIMFLLINTIFTTSCTKDQWCMACSSTTQNQCDACFNWADSDRLSKALNTSATPQDCRTPLSLTISGCKWYSGLETTTSSSRSVTTCNICDREYLRWN